jgi:hypothetical protein
MFKHTMMMLSRQTNIEKTDPLTFVYRFDKNIVGNFGEHCRILLGVVFSCAFILPNIIGKSNARLEDNGNARKFCHFGRSAIFGLAWDLLVPFWQV